MSLPVLGLATSTVDVAGTSVSIRSLSRDEAFRMEALKDDPTAADVFILVCGTDTPEADVIAWRAASSFDDVQAVSVAILELSGLLDPKGPKTSI